MALKHRSRGRLWSGLHFLIRFTGLTGVLAIAAGFMMVAPTINWAALDLSAYRDIWTWTQVEFQEVPGRLLSQYGPNYLQAVQLLLGVGTSAAIIALLVEVLGIVFMTAGRRSAFGFNVLAQVVLAVLLLAIVNGYTFLRGVRYDWKRDQRFALTEEVKQDLMKLRDNSKTTIIVYQRHKTFGHIAGKPDPADYAAERVVVKKVKDLVDEFRELGPQFRVEVLDVEEQGFNDKLNALTAQSPKLREAIDAAPENSIFFYDPENNRVQRLSFNDFYLLDKTSSKEKDNLVLRYQGLEPFTRKVLYLDEKRPTIGIAVIHELLSTEGNIDDYGMSGLKKTLQARGFNVRDILLKKWSEFGPPEAKVYTYSENKLDRLEEELLELDANVRNLKAAEAELTKLREYWETAKLDDLTEKYKAILGGQKVTEARRKLQLESWDEQIAEVREELGKEQKNRDQTSAQLEDTLKQEQNAEERRIDDQEAKLKRLLADCDLLIIPRMTLRNLAMGDRIPPALYRVDDNQLAAIKDFIKAGKPVLACFGPINDSQDRPNPLGSGSDGVDDLLRQLGIKFGNQTVLFNVESKAFAERRSGLVFAGSTVPVPPVEFDWKPGAGRLLLSKEEPEDRKPKDKNPIRESMQVVARSAGEPLDIRLRHPRPVYYEPAGDRVAPFQPVFMMTDPASWNEDQPFPSRGYTPRFKPAEPDSPGKGTVDERRRGPFPVGVAVEATVPAEWYSDKAAEPKTVRVAAIGHGGLFSGKDLSPGEERLFLTTCNWLLGRDHLLAKEGEVWEYKRKPLDRTEQFLWYGGALLGLPGVFAYLGLVVLLVRRLR